jgi:iron complex outermembrane receptor protein
MLLRPTVNAVSLAYGIERLSRRLVRASSLASLSLVAATAVHAAGQTDINVEVPAGSLQAALVSYAARANISIKFEATDLADKRTSGLKGTMTAQEGLDKLLAGSGLQYRKVSDGVYVVTAVAAPKAVVPADAVSQKDFQTIFVAGGADTNNAELVTERSRTATRTDTLLGQTPQSVTVITSKLLEQQQTKTVQDALSNAAGVSVSGSSGFSQSVFVRGFLAPISVDGVAEAAAAASKTASPGLSTPMAAVDAVEVMKGADAIMSGAGGGMALGGAVNVVLKKPTAQTVHELTMEVGSYGHVLTSVDLGGALSEDKRWTYRLVASGSSDNTSFAGYNGPNDSYLLASLGFTQGDTSVVVGAEKDHARFVMGQTVPMTNTGEFLPLLSPLGSVDDRIIGDRQAVFAELRQNLANDWKLQLKLKSTKNTYSSSYYGLPLPSGNTVSPLSYEFYPTQERRSSDQDSIDFAVTKTLKAWDIEQKITAGFNVQKTVYGAGATYASGFSFSDGSTVLPQISDFSDESTSKTTMMDTNLFVQDQVHYGKWYGLLSVAKGTEWGTAQYSGSWAGYPDTSYERTSSVSPSFGILYQLTDSVALFGNARKSFESQVGLEMADGSTPTPKRGVSHELGSKIYLNEDKLTLNLALFRNEQQNIATLVPGQFTKYYMVAGQTSKGFEAELTGEITRGLRGVVAFTHTQYDDLSQTSNGGLPMNRLKVYASYDLPGERLQGWTVGAGVTARTGYQAVYPDPMNANAYYSVPGTSSWDADVSYSSKAWKLILGVKDCLNNSNPSVLPHSSSSPSRF